MGILDLAAPALDAIDAAWVGVLPSAVRIGVWAFVASAASMGLYALISPQRTIARLKAQATAARKRLARYDADLKGLGPVAREALAASFKHLGATLAPVLVASLPVLVVMAWLSTAYGYRYPQPGTAVEVATSPAGATLTVSTATADGADTVAWPRDGETVVLRDGAGRAVVRLPLAAPVPVVHKQRWWNIFLGNPAGYLPEATPLERVELALPRRHYLDAGPAWLGTWEVIFVTALVICSLAIKRALRVV